ncbi:MAG: C4-dicarboxylate ABC transporter [Hyphomicrobiales bacterium]|nr:MAG: C4-dicarboxylate ABC transporter [Hyphomicrobiales bacterium]
MTAIIDADTHGTEKPPRLARLPFSIFAVIMGLAGLTIATEKMEQHLHSSHMLSHAMTALVVFLFAGLALLQLLRLARHPQAIRAEWSHPVRISFFPAAAIGLLLLSVALIPHHPNLSFVFWATGAVLQFILAFMVINTWINATHFEPHHVNPAWFIPAVGNVIVPVAGVTHGYVEVSWFFFAFGMIFWIVLLAIVMNRLFFHHPLHEHMVPTLCILIAPPAAGFLAYFKLIGQVDAFAHFLYYAALVFSIIVALQIGTFRRLKFTLSWWAYSFPLAAVTIATLVMAEHAENSLLNMLSLGLYALALLVISGLTVRTILGFVRDDI